MKKIFIILSLFLILVGCNAKDKIVETSVKEIDNNGNAILNISKSDLDKLDFECGDSVNIAFNNGLVFNDIPCYSGMYVDYGEVLLYVEEVSNSILIVQKYVPFIDSNNVKKGDELKIELNEKDKYKKIEEFNDYSYTNEYEDYGNEEVYANFRQVTVGNIKPGRLFRSTSPINNQINRASYANKLARENGVKTIVDLVDTEEKLNELKKNALDELLSLYDMTSVTAIGLTVDYLDMNNISKLANGYRAIINGEGPYLLHCLEGKDRTGASICYLECLCNASYEEIVDDYMKTYDNFYSINKTDEPEKYAYIKEKNIDALLNDICGTENRTSFTKQELNKAVRDMFIEYGMSNEELDALVDKLCN